MPKLEQIAESGIFTFDDRVIARQFKSFDEELTSRCLAEQVNSKKISIGDLIFGLFLAPYDKSVLGIPEIAVEQHAIKPAYYPIIFAMLANLKNPDELVMGINWQDPHFAAKCIGHRPSLKRETKQEVIHRLSLRQKLEYYSFDLLNTVEALGETKSSFAMPLLEQMIMRDCIICPEYMQSSSEPRGNALFALARMPGDEGIKLLYAYMTNFRIITGRKKAHRYMALRVMQHYADPQISSRFLFNEFLVGGLYQYYLFSQDRQRILEDLAQPSKIPCMNGKSYHFTGRSEERMFSYNPDESPSAIDILEALAEMADTALAKKIVLCYRGQFAHDSVTEWHQEMAREMLPHLNDIAVTQLTLEHFLTDDEFSEINKYPHLRRRSFERPIVNSLFPVQYHLTAAIKELQRSITSAQDAMQKMLSAERADRGLLTIYLAHHGTKKEVQDIKSTLETEKDPHMRHYLSESSLLIQYRLLYEQA